MAEIRISAAEREAALTALAEHHTTGRLPLGEYEARARVAAEAFVRSDLEPLFADLPAPHPDLSAAVAAGRTERPAFLARLVVLFRIVAALFFFVGLPVAVVLTVTNGWWWLIPVAVGMSTTGLTVARALNGPRDTVALTAAG